jgi:uncharacterized protein YndB with AHSA1/START domain
MTVTRVFDAPRELVWKAWTDPKYVVQWWGPKGCSSPSCTADFREGGKFLYSMKLPDGQVFYTGGEYHEIVPPEKVVFSMYFADAQGNKVQPEQLGFDHEAIAGAPDVVTFEDLGNGQTRLTYVGNETMADATASGQTEGTRQSLDKLAAVVAELAQAK